MKFRVIIFLTSLLIASGVMIFGMGLESTQRQYHDSYLGNVLCDTIVTLCPETKNNQTKAIEIRATSTIKRRADATVAYGTAWGIASDGSMYQAILGTTNHADNDDIANIPSVMLTIRQIKANGDFRIIDRVALTKEIDTEQCHNTLATEIDCQSGIVKILAGDDIPQIVAELTISPIEAQLGLGVIAIGRPTFDVIVSEHIVDKSAELQTQWGIADIENHLSQQSGNTIEGFWQYLDRDNAPQYCRLGGKYKLAIIANDSAGYDIIYISGAEVSASDWQTGMLKGQLSPTKFKNHYNLIWIDSMLNQRSEECSVTLEQDAVLRFDFPLLNTSLRFYKQ